MLSKKYIKTYGEVILTKFSITSKFSIFAIFSNVYNFAMSQHFEQFKIKYIIASLHIVILNCKSHF